MKNFNNKSKTKRGLSPRNWALVSQCRHLKHSVLLLFLIIFGAYHMTAQSPLEANGQLSVAGTNLVNEKGTPVQLRGMSSHGIQWHTEVYNFNTLSLLVHKWGIDVFRIAIAPSLKNDGNNKTTLGYDGNPDFWKKYIDNLVDECGQLGIYCIIDWHILAPVTDPSDPSVFPTLAEEFWNYMSKKHANKPWVIYEICNEPSGVNWSGTGGVKSYAETIIPIIRANDPKALILVGNPNYSADLDNVAADPLTGDNATNVMYTLHFYAASHKQERRDMITRALEKNLPVFVSEWGTTTYSGDGTIDYPETDTWLSFMKANNLSWCNWDYSDDSNTPASSALQNGIAAFATPGELAFQSPENWGYWDQTTDEGNHVKTYLSDPADAWTSSGSWKPAVGLYFPYDGFNSLTGNMVVLRAEGIAHTGSITSIDFFANNNKIGTGQPDPINSPGLIKFPFSMAWVPTTAGDYVITAVALDNNGVSSSSALPITIHIRDAATMPKSTPYNGTPITIPGTIQCSNFDKGGEMVAYHDLDAIHKGPVAGNDRQDEAVDVEGTGSTADVGYVISGEWMNYTVNVQTSGLYTLTMTIAAPDFGTGINSWAFHLESNNHKITPILYLQSTGTNWGNAKYVAQTFSYRIPLSAGEQKLKLYADRGIFNYLTAKLELQTGTMVHTITTTSTSGHGNVNAVDGPMGPCGTFTVADEAVGAQILAWPHPDYVVNDAEVDGTILTETPGTDPIILLNGDGVFWNAHGILDFVRVTGDHTVNVNFKQYQSVSQFVLTPDNNGNYTAQSSASSGLPVTFTSSDPSVASITSQGIITLHKPGTFTITASQTGDSIFASSDIAKTPVSNTYTVTSILATAGTGGSISPSGTLLLLAGSSKTYTITPSADYKINDVIVDGVSQGPVTSYTFSSLTAAAHTISATFTSLCTLAKLFGVPRSTALPTFTATFMHAYVIGTGGPNLTTVNTFAINWDLANKGLYNCAFNFNASPWYLSLIPLTTNTFASASPSCTIKGSGIAGLDGSYYVNWDGSNLVLVSKTGNFAIYGSNAAKAPAGCPLSKDAIAESIEHGSLDLFPNPVDRSGAITINLGSVSSEGAKIIIMDLSGKLVYSDVLRSTTNSLNLGGKISSGLYIVKIINGNEQYNAKLIVR